MRRSMLFFSVVLLSLVTASAQVVVTPSGYATMPGPAIVPAAPSAPLLTTPVVNLGITSPNPVGATNATAGNQVGATNSTLANLPGPTKPVTTVPEYMSAETGSAAVPSLVPGTTPSPTGQEQQQFSLGAAQINSAYNATAKPVTESLAQIARQYRRKDATESAKVYTNDDVENLPQPTTGGITGAVESAAPQPPPAGQQQPQRSLPASPATPQAKPKPPQKQTSISQGSTTEISEAQPSASMGSAGQTTESPQNQSSQKGAKKSAKLPTGASSLPLIALLGVGMAITGLMWRR